MSIVRIFNVHLLVRCVPLPSPKLAGTSGNALGDGASAIWETCRQVVGNINDGRGYLQRVHLPHEKGRKSQSPGGEPLVVMAPRGSSVLQ